MSEYCGSLMLLESLLQRSQRDGFEGTAIQPTATLSSQAENTAAGQRAEFKRLQVNLSVDW